MFCPKCGTDVGQSKFCSNCGAKLSEENKGNGFLNQVQTKTKDAVQWFKTQEPKKQKIMIISAVLVVVLLFVFAGGTGSGVKDQLCDGVWCYQFAFEGSSFTTIDFGPSISTYVYEFKPNGTFKIYYGCYYSEYDALMSTPMEESYTGKYSIDEEKCQIILEYDGDTETEKIPYAINEYTHEMLFDVNSSGKSSYWNEKSLEDAMFYYNHRH